MILSPATVRKVTRREYTLLFAFPFAFYALLGYFLTSQFKYASLDTLSRTANALYVLYSRYPHLGAMGFVWPPLPSLMMLPLTTAREVFPILTTGAYAADLVSGLFAALTVPLLRKILKELGVGVRVSYLLLALYFFNPVTVLYGVNGMTEAYFAFFALVMVRELVWWNADRGQNHLIIASIACGLGFLCRYESIPYAVAGAVVLILLSLGTKRAAHLLEANLILFLVPLAYLVSMWMLLNWMLMKDPIYFLHGQYSHFGQSVAIHATRSAFEQAAAGNVVGTALFVASMVWEAAPVYYLAGPLALIFAWLWRDRLPAVLFLFSLTTPGTQAILAFLGATQWVRYYSVLIPFSIVLVGYIVGTAAAKARVARQSLANHRGQGEAALKWLMHPASGSVAAALLVCSLVATPPLSARSLLTNNGWDAGSADILAQSVMGLPANAPLWQPYAEVAAYLDAKGPDRGLTLVDTFHGYGIVLFSNSPKLFVIPADPDYRAILQRPGGVVSYIVVSGPDRMFDSVADAYPQLYNYGESFAVLEKEFSGMLNWRVYRVLGTSSQADSGRPVGAVNAIPPAN